MARMYQGILGGLSGKIGNVVGSSWKGIPVLKTKPLSVANPQTAAQVAQRDKMEAVVAFATPILATVIKPLWDRFASRMSGFNAFVQANIGSFVSVGEFTPSTVKISEGKGAATVVNSVDSANGQAAVQLFWTDDSGEGYKLATDEVYAVVYNITKQEICSQFEVGVRSAGVIECVLPSNVATGNLLACYLGFRRADGTVVFDSSYKSETV